LYDGRVWLAGKFQAIDQPIFFKPFLNRGPLLA
jgi:hypothetical protein